MNDSLRSDVFVRFAPETIACACIFLAARNEKVHICKMLKLMHFEVIIQKTRVLFFNFRSHYLPSQHGTSCLMPIVMT